MSVKLTADEINQRETFKIFKIFTRHVKLSKKMKTFIKELNDIKQSSINKLTTQNTTQQSDISKISYGSLMILDVITQLLIQIQMGNEQICKKCERITTDNASQGKHSNKRQIVTLSYGTKLPNNLKDVVATSIKEASELQLPSNFQNFTGKGKIEYKVGWTYEGDIINGIREGRGRMTWPTGDYYEGQFVSGRASGRGVFQTSKGPRYQGQFINDEIIRGKRISADGLEIYDGSFLNHNFDGYGTLIVHNSFEYRGMFRKNMMEGSGRIKYSDGSTYEGAFKANKKHGYGVYTYPNGYHFEGHWKQGERVGDLMTQPSNIINLQRNCEVVF